MPAGVVSSAAVQSPSTLHALPGFAAAPTVTCRHVVFTSAAKGNGRALNLAPPARAATFPRPEPALSVEEWRFVEWLFTRCGLAARDYRAGTIKRQLPACLRACGVDCVSRGRAALTRSPERAAAAIGALVIGVTGFFRDAPVFDTLRERVIPELIRDAAQGGRRGLRVWSAGCSDGSELYSVAMLLAEADALDGSELIGTDCRTRAVERASRGTFDAPAVDAVPSPLRDKYLVSDGGRFRVWPNLRGATRWHVADLISSASPADGFDLILCRNVFIYLTPAAAARIWERVAVALRPGGVLVVGKAERPLGVDALCPVAPCIYRRRRS